MRPRSESLRALVRETSLEPGDLIYPVFICPGEGVRKPIGSMPGVYNLSVDEAEIGVASCAGARNVAGAGRPDLPSVYLPWRGRPQAHRLHARRVQPVGR